MNYEDPEGFRTNLNATIQELRNVTFVLQKEKEAIPNFESWYSEWQTRLKQDPLARWLIDARNQIVKQGDLETASTAKAELVDSYLSREPNVLRVDPIVTNKAIALALASTVPLAARTDGVLIVDRRWEVATLPGQDLLDVLAKCFRTLMDLVVNAHARAGSAFVPVECERSPPHGRDETVGQMKCMRPSDVYRRSVVDLETGRLMVLGSKAFKSKLREEVVRQRYGPVSPIDPKGRTLEEVAGLFHMRATHLLEVDGYHHAVIEFLRDGSIVGVRLLRLGNRAEKYATWHALAREAIELGADALVAINEAWWAKADPENPNRHAVDAPDRGEVLQTVAASVTGEQVVVSTHFTHSADGKIQLGETFRQDDAEVGFLLPIAAAWRKQRMSDAGVDS